MTMRGSAFRAARAMIAMAITLAMAAPCIAQQAAPKAAPAQQAAPARRLAQRHAHD